ncbi:MAG: right-handed parallel beta-helix repeat-containing protein, partial [Methanoregulaceae archaeon]|nr:right-handed parallel beta-helix repeat-containing protein [Methanoregulaceae archaeon]
MNTKVLAFLAILLVLIPVHTLGDIQNGTDIQENVSSLAMETGETATVITPDAVVTEEMIEEPEAVVTPDAVVTEEMVEEPEAVVTSDAVVAEEMAEEPGAVVTSDAVVTEEMIEEPGAENTLASGGLNLAAVQAYVIPVSELPVIITDNYVAQHGHSFIIGGDWTGTSNDRQGVFIVASDVTLDGDSHTLTGKIPNIDPYPTGVLVYGSNVTVKNIQLKGWYDGICVANANGGRIENVNSRENKMGIDIHTSTNIQVVNNQANSNTDSGIFLYLSSRGNTITGNSASSNTKIGINVHSGSNDNYLADNIVNDNKDTGILLYNVSANNTVERNTALRNTHNGIDIWTNNNKVLVNNFSNNAGGIYFDGASNNLVSGNTVLNNKDGGIISAYYSGKPTTGNIIQNNVIQGTVVSGASSQNIGIILYTGSSQNTVKGNTITQNNGGILLHGSTSNAIYNNLFRNVVWNTLFEGTTTGNTWNTTMCSGPNIVNGPYIGGNYWANPSGTGFSEVTNDTNGDGFCDSPYQIISGAYPPTPTGQYDRLP